MVVKGQLVGQETEIKAHTLPGIQKWLSDSVSLEAGLAVWTPLLTDPAGFPQQRCVRCRPGAQGSEQGGAPR